ncbi:acyl-CoA dehydrogenase family protein [Catenuloplanes atrovinosus]|uniref:acyl-CoA oxidase n=1 Tax=Catenuloplanes atrovinosus TaxID=137266 RepID=A0AAE4CA47_9ACTN|nr:acyl-CoA dehydrogenase [Catenuloplanes atrovinosus]MDR7275474.1 acyl-CoA oxidase [Catenuloplanes atrovinosus]
MTDDLADRLREVLDGRWAHLRRAARQKLDSRFVTVPGETGDQARERISRLVREIPPEVGVTAGFPAEFGGADDPGGSMVATETLAQVDLSLMVKAGVQWGLFGGAVYALGTRRHHEAWLPGIIAGDVMGCFAMTETGHGSDVQRLRTTAVYHPETETFDLHTPYEAARKDYIGNAARDGRMAVVFAQLIVGERRHGVHAFLVPIRDDRGRPMPGVTIGDAGAKAGLLGVDNGRIAFHHVTVDREMLLDRYGQVAPDGTYTSSIANDTRRFFTMLGTLVRGRVSVGGSASAAAKSALTIAVRYGESRRQFTAPDSEREVVLNDYLAHRRKLLTALARSYALSFAQEKLVRDLSDALAGGEIEDRRQRELESRAAGLKAVQTWNATRTIQLCREACGGAGYLAENRLPGLKADTDVFTTFEGDNTVLLQLVGKGLLTGYRDAFGSLDGWGRAAFAAEQVREMVLERTAARSLITRLVDAVPKRGDSVGLTERGWHLSMFEEREKHLLEGAVRRLRRGAETKRDRPFDIFNDVQDHVLAAASAHVDRVVLEAFVAGVEEVADAPVKALLDKVCDLYALSTIEADKGWFMEHERLTPARAKAVTAAVNDLLTELRPRMRTLVDGFGVPDAWLNAAILREEADRQAVMSSADHAAAGEEIVPIG